MKNQTLDTLVRDLTSIPPMPKSEVRKRLKAFRDQEIHRALDAVGVEEKAFVTNKAHSACQGSNASTYCGSCLKNIDWNAGHNHVAQTIARQKEDYLSNL